MGITIKQQVLDYVRTRSWTGETYGPAFDTPAAEAEYMRRLGKAASVTIAHLREWSDGGASGVLWVTVIDARAAPLCRVLSGTRWTIPNTGILIPPVHVDCRCMLSPIYGTGPRQPLNYESWLQYQPTTRQDRILGKDLAEQFRAGRTLHEMLEDMVYGS